MKRFLVPILVVLIGTSLHAQDVERMTTESRIAKQSSTVMGDRGLFTVPSAETLNRGQFGFGVGWSNVDRTPKDLDITTFPVSFAVGVLSRLTLIGTFETQRQVKASNLVQSGFNPSYPYVSSRFNQGPGDTTIAGKYRLWRQRDNIGGIAIKGFLKIGTADSQKGLGSGQADGGVDLIFTSQLPWKFRDFLLHSMVGFTETRNGKEPFALTIKDEIRSGLGLAWPSAGLKVGRGSLQGVFEYVTTTFVGAGAPNAAPVAVQNPSDVTGGLRLLMLDNGVTFDAGYRVNTKFDRDFPNNSQRTGFTFGVSFTKPVAAAGNNHYPVVALEADSNEIAAGGSATITASGYDADNDSLTYSWNATGGQLEGTGEKVTFRAAGLAPGTYTVRATASDGKGGVGNSQIDIVVRR